MSVSQTSKNNSWLRREVKSIQAVWAIEDRVIAVEPLRSVQLITVIYLAKLSSIFYFPFQSRKILLTDVSFFATDKIPGG